MDTLYSISLLVAAVAGAASIASSVLALVPAPEAPSRNMGRWSIVLAALGTAALLASFVVHLRWGHGSTSAEPLDLSGFLAAHPSYLVVAVELAAACALFALLRARLASKERSRDAA